MLEQLKAFEGKVISEIKLVEGKLVVVVENGINALFHLKDDAEHVVSTVEQDVKPAIDAAQQVTSEVSVTDAQPTQEAVPTEQPTEQPADQEPQA